MTDVRAILERQSQTRRRRARLHNGLAVVCTLLFPLFAYIYSIKGRPVLDSFRLLFPLMFVTSAGIVYSSRHIQSLRDAIADPDPALDPHFAEALAMEREEVAKIGREAFVQRFADRAPELDPMGWANVAKGLKNASIAQAESLLRMLAAGGTFSAIEGMESFAKATPTDRLQTATHQALGDLRLRVAREKVLGASRESDLRQEAEVARLGL